MGNDREPSGYQIEQALGILSAVKTRLLETDPDMAADERLLLDMLEGESGNAMDTLYALARAAIHAERMAKDAKERIDDIRARQERYRHRAETLRGAMFGAMSALGLPKLEQGDFTASIRNGQPSVQITDETALPAAFVRVRREPDKALISAALKAGQDIPGAMLSNAAPSIQIRSR